MRPYVVDALERETRFQSTHPTRGCDAVFIAVAPHNNIFQSTHPTRGCDVGRELSFDGYSISIHAPHEGVRHDRKGGKMEKKKFQSTHPTRGCDL